MANKIDKNIVIFYHGNCSDGFGAAWSAWKKFGDLAEYIPVNHGEPCLQLAGKEVYFLDILYPQEDLDYILKNNPSIFVIDHHQTNEERIKGLENYVFDNSKSASVLSWEYFNPDTNTPYLLKCIQDMDLWKWELSDSKEMMAYLGLFPNDFSVWDKISEDIEDEDKRIEYIQGGAILLKYEDNLVNEIVSEAQVVNFEGYDTCVVNSSILTSRVGNLLVRKKPPIAIIWVERKDFVTVSLRSDGVADVGKIAKKYGGGGHRASAGFKIPLGSKLPWSRT